MSAAAAIGSDPSPVRILRLPKGRKVGRDVASGCLAHRGYRDSVAVVLDEIEQGQALGGRDIERRPESVRRRRRLAAVRHGDACRDRRVLEYAVAIAQCLRPAGCRRVLGADAAAGGQQARTVTIRPVDDDTDITAARHPLGSHHRGGKRLLRRYAERQRERPRPIVRRDAVAPAGQLLSQEDLGHVVAARAELVQDLAFREQARFFQRIERARNEDRAQYGCPVLHDSRVPVPTGIFASLAPRRRGLR